MDVLGTIVNFVLVALTLVVIWFAWQTVRESRKATSAAQETVGELKALREADERHRRWLLLRDIGALVRDISHEASAAVAFRGQERSSLPFRSAKQGSLEQLLVDADPPLPDCRALAASRTAQTAVDASGAAQREIDEAFRTTYSQGRLRR